MNHDTEPDGEGDLPVPAGAIRVVAGLVIMVSGFLIAVFSRSELAKGIGLLLFFLSTFVMLTWKKKEE